MGYRVHRLEVKKSDAQQSLERFLNELEGEVVSVTPFVTPVFRPMGATAKVALNCSTASSLRPSLANVAA